MFILKENITALAKEKRTMKDTVDLLNEKIESQQAEIEEKQNAIGAVKSLIVNQQAEIEALKHQRDQAVEAVQKLSAGQTITQVAEGHLIQNMQREIEALKTQPKKDAYLIEAQKREIKVLQAVRDENEEAQAEIEALKERLEAQAGHIRIQNDRLEKESVFAKTIVKDAERYRWVRDKAPRDFCDGGFTDSDIDAAMEAEE